MSGQRPRDFDIRTCSIIIAIRNQIQLQGLGVCCLIHNYTTATPSPSRRNAYPSARKRIALDPYVYKTFGDTTKPPTGSPEPSKPPTTLRPPSTPPLQPLLVQRDSSPFHHSDKSHLHHPSPPLTHNLTSPPHQKTPNPNNALLLLLQNPNKPHRDRRIKKRHPHHRHPQVRRPVPEHQAR